MPQMIGNSLGGDVIVEFDDLDDHATTEGPTMTRKKEYDHAEVLDSGWVRAVGKGEEVDDDEVNVDYYPPQRVNGIFTIENPDE